MDEVGPGLDGKPSEGQKEACVVLDSGWTRPRRAKLANR